MSIPPLSTSSIQDPTSTSQAFAFPGTPSDHPAAVELHPEPEPEPEASRGDDDDDDEQPHHRHSRGHHHRPHLHISEHLHRRTNDHDLGQGDDHRPGNGAELLKVPETKTPRARSLDATTGGDKTAQAAVVEGKQEGKPSGYESPSTPADQSREATTGTTDVQPTQDTSDPKPRFDDVWAEIRYERYEKPGVTPLYLTETLTTLQSLTRAHTLKLAGARRTIQHRMAEWAVLHDKLDAIDAEARELGRALVGAADWARMAGDDQPPPPREEDRASPVKHLEALQSTTQHAEHALNHLAATVRKRKADVGHLSGKVEADGRALERRMGRGLERKMEAIERAEADAKRRDLIINIVTFTALILLGILLSWSFFRLSSSTGRWGVVVGRDWFKAGLELVRKGSDR